VAGVTPNLLLKEIEDSKYKGKRLLFTGLATKQAG